MFSYPSKTADFVFRKEMWERSSDFGAVSESSGVQIKRESGCITLNIFLLNPAVFTPSKAILNRLLLTDCYDSVIEYFHLLQTLSDRQQTKQQSLHSLKETAMSKNISVYFCML